MAIRRGDRLLIVGRRKRPQFFDPKTQSTANKLEFGGFRYFPLIVRVDKGFSLTKLKNFDYRGRKILDTIAIAAVVSDVKRLFKLKRNSRERKQILNRLLFAKGINFPAFVDPTCPSFPMCGFRPGTQLGKDSWLEKWERKLILKWLEEHRKESKALTPTMSKF